jgi:hypothetical protein
LRREVGHVTKIDRFSSGGVCVGTIVRGASATVILRSHRALFEWLSGKSIVARTVVRTHAMATTDAAGNDISGQIVNLIDGRGSAWRW